MVRPVDKKGVPAATVPRLALYLRKLRELHHRSVTRVSSHELAEMTGLNAAQIRKDFSYFGEFGTRGVGYEVARLIDEISHSVGLDRTWNVIIVGADPLGTALVWHRGFHHQGFRLVGMFDNSPDVIGAVYGGGPGWHADKLGDSPDVIGAGCGGGRVRDIAELEEFCRAEPVDIAMVTVPAAEAAQTIERLGALGVRAILNFTPVKVRVPNDVLVRQVDLSGELMSLTFWLDGRRR